MSRLIKEKMVQEYGERFRGVSELAVIETQGIDVKRLTAFRGVLRERGIRAMQVHNRLGKRALAAGGLAGLESLLHGPSVLVWGGESIVDIAKALAGEAKTLTELQVRGGMSAGEVLSKEQMASLAELPSREELIGGVVAMAIGQGGRVVAAAMAMGGRLAAQIREIHERATPDEAAPAEPAAADEAPAAEPAAAGDEAAAADSTPDTQTGVAKEPPAPDKPAGE